MQEQEFIKNFAELFDDTDAAAISLETNFHELDEWDSMAAMALIAMAKTAYGKTITGKEIRGCNTVGDLFNLIAAK